MDRAGVLPAIGASLVRPGGVPGISIAGVVMAGEWIKLDLSTPDKPEVFKIARIINIDPDAVIGKLLRLWSWVDSISVDGVVDGVVSTDVDRVCRCDGFAVACESVGWLVIDDVAERITLPNFDNHNGETAKQRALKNRRQAKWRAHASTQTSTPPSTTASTREEKRREEKKKEQKQKPPPAAPVAATMPDLPTWVNREAWDGFAAMRKRERHPLTPRAAKLVLTALGKLRDSGHDPNVVLDQSTRNGWRDVWPVKDSGHASAVGGRVAI
jgi:hypothetical protein